LYFYINLLLIIREISNGGGGVSAVNPTPCVNGTPHNIDDGIKYKLISLNKNNIGNTINHISLKIGAGALVFPYKIY